MTHIEETLVARIERQQQRKGKLISERELDDGGTIIAGSNTHIDADPKALEGEIQYKWNIISSKRMQNI